MLLKVKNFIKKHRLLNDNDKIIVALSGGPDSVALLHLLLKLDYKCIAAHCNFHLRMEESDRDALFVRKLTDEIGVKLEYIDFDTINYAKNNNISIEMAARELRYTWFQKLAEIHNANVIATGHHADDNIETLLINLVRGTSIKGLSGIPVKNGIIVRPMLSCSREEIYEYLNENNLTYIIDSTNNESDYVRNKIRNKVLPLLEEINPSVKMTLNSNIERFNEIRSVYEQSMEEKIRKVVHKTETDIKIDLKKLLESKSENLILFEVLYPLGFHPSVIEQIISSVNAESGKTFYSDSHRLLKDRNYLIINANTNIDKRNYFISQEVISINEPFLMKIDRFERRNELNLITDKNTLLIDAELLKFPLTIRRWQTGDYFYPFGTKGRKKVSDFFIDNKFTLFDKENTWLLISEEKIIWIVGNRADNRFKITENTKEIIKFELIQQ